MSKKAILVLADGSVFPGYSFGAESDGYGEVVFNTSMTGYQEMLTDPSYAGQIVVPTYPLIGNYGINEQDAESARIQVRAFVVREECLEPNHFRNSQTVHQYLSSSGIPGMFGVDTRALTRKLRAHGVMMGYVTSERTPEQAYEQLKKVPSYGSLDFVKEVSCLKKYEWPHADDSRRFRVAVLDCGTKFNILRLLTQRGCAVTTWPCTAAAGELLESDPDGIVLSPGPGDPELLNYVVKTVRGLVEKKPIMGICLGNQLLARAFGGRNFKLKFGHRGGNHPVKEFSTGRVHITAQNHGYAVDADSLKNGLEVSHINLNDGTVEGLRHKELPIFSIQYHSEASPGPLDNTYLFDRFIEMMAAKKA